MKHPLAILFVILSLAVTIWAQQTNERAANNPLDCAILLFSKDSSRFGLSDFLTRALFRSGRDSDAIEIARSNKVLFGGFEELSVLGLERLRTGDKVAAIKFANAAFDDYSAEVDGVSADRLFPLVDLMIELGKPEFALKIVEQQGEPEEKAKILVELAKAYFKYGDKDASLNVLETAITVFDSHDYRDMFDRADQFIKLGEKARALDLVSKIENDDVILSDKLNLDKVYCQLFFRFMELGDYKRAASNWEQIANNDDVSARLEFSSGMMRGRRFAEAERVLANVSQEELEQYQVGREVVKQYLELGKTASAERSAKVISVSNDDEDQQDAFLQIADHYIKLKENVAAAAILDLAFRRASKIVFEHEQGQNNGASPGTRKWIYLKNISTRYIQIGKIEQAYTAIAAIYSDHELARERFATGTARFARENAKRLSSTRINQIYVAALKAIGEMDSEYRVEIIVNQAEAAAIIGKPDKAADILSEMFANRSDRFPVEYALILAGEVFEKYHLQTNDSLRNSLTKIIEDAED